MGGDGIRSRLQVSQLLELSRVGHEVFRIDPNRLYWPVFRKDYTDQVWPVPRVEDGRMIWFPQQWNVPIWEIELDR